MDMLRINVIPKCNDIYSLNYWNYVCCLVGLDSVYGAGRCNSNSPQSLSVCQLQGRDAWLIIYVLSIQEFRREFRVPLNLFFFTLIKFCNTKKFFSETKTTSLNIEFNVTEQFPLYRSGRYEDGYNISQDIAYDLVDDMVAFIKKSHSVKIRFLDSLYTAQYYPYNLKQTEPGILSLQIIMFSGQYIGRYNGKPRNTIGIADIFLDLFGKGKLAIDNSQYKDIISPRKAAICENVFCNSTVRSIGMNESFSASCSNTMLYPRMLNTFIVIFVLYLFSV